jgi:hypothetical protein
VSRNRAVLWVGSVTGSAARRKLIHRDLKSLNILCATDEHLLIAVSTASPNQTLLSSSANHTLSIRRNAESTPRRVPP